MRDRPASERNAVITGAGSGVGRATAFALAREGYAVALIGRTRATLEATANAIEALGGRSVVAPADVGEEADVTSAMQRIGAELGAVEALICAAGVGLYGPVGSYALADWQRTLATNLTGVFLTCKAVLPAMTARGGGAIIAIGSGAGKQGYANLAAYSASKFGLLGFMQSLAAEVGPAKIKVSAINPGSILTGFAGRSTEEKERQQAEGRAYLQPEDVAAAVLYLLAQPARAWTQEMNLWPV
jgi:3-oxoacyl-[acyl-carrier protein] reductase